jgi:hypothetical protein
VTLVADADVPDPVIRSLQAVRYDIIRYTDLGLPSTPDTALMEALLERGGILDGIWSNCTMKGWQPECLSEGYWPLKPGQTPPGDRWW